LDVGQGIVPHVGYTTNSVSLTERIGRGAYSTVFKAECAVKNESMALKFIAKSRLNDISKAANAHSEIRSLGRLEHENVVKLHEVIHTIDHIVLRMDYVGSKNFYKYLNENPRPNLADLFGYQLQITLAVAYIHGNSIAHRDIKPENIAIMEQPFEEHAPVTLKLLDFGCALAARQVAHDIAGTVPFIAPEILLRDSRGYMPCSADMWSCGILLLEMLCGIGRMNRIFNWGNTCNPSPSMGSQLNVWFHDPANLRAVLMTERNNEQLPQPISEALFSLLTTCPKNRWGSSQLKTCEWLRRP
jgi:serine/threonine protein kinase